MTEILNILIDRVADRTPKNYDFENDKFIYKSDEDGSSLYRNKNEKLNIDFSVDKLNFSDIQTMDPRIVTISPSSNNELHKHAHESIFYIIKGTGKVVIGKDTISVSTGDIAFVPRWIFHQSKNTSNTEDLVILAITDFGLTSAVLGDYDKRTRLAEKGDDAVFSL
ncbi:MAG: cupin domain-containing protein [Pseudomonadota bacterium]